MQVILFFIDGVGLGASVPENPFVFTDTPFLEMLFRGNSFTKEIKGFHDTRVTLRGLDAGLGVEGLPQSATGQTTIFTGINAPGRLGYHLNGFPNGFLRELLAKKNVFASLQDDGYRCTFVNAYRPSFFEKLKEGLPGERYSCTTLITYHGGLPFYRLDDIKSGKALFMDLTNKLLNSMGYAVPELTPEEAGKRLIRIGRGFDFSLFEYFLTDRAGHLADKDRAGEVVRTLDRFLGAAVEALDPSQMILIVTSDHGNLEDISHSMHTFNEVPALLFGAEEARQKVAFRMHDLTDILPAVRAFLKA